LANDRDIPELVAELLIGFDKMVEQQIKTNEKLDRVTDGLGRVVDKLSRMENRRDKVESHISKLNLLSAENNRAILKLANQMEQFIDLDPRVRKLESAVFK
jgi:methyl-accepting chemotaxis protein